MRACDTACEAWLPSMASHDINELESLAAVMWVETFGPAIKHADVCLFVDSAAAEGSLLKGYSSSPHLAALAGQFWASAASYGLRMWVDRVPSSLNPADELSRDSDKQARGKGWQQVVGRVPHPEKWSFLHDAAKIRAAEARPRRMAKRRFQNQGQ